MLRFWILIRCIAGLVCFVSIPIFLVPHVMLWFSWKVIPRLVREAETFGNCGAAIGRKRKAYSHRWLWRTSTGCRWNELSFGCVIKLKREEDCSWGWLYRCSHGWFYAIASFLSDFVGRNVRGTEPTKYKDRISSLTFDLTSLYFCVLFSRCARAGDSCESPGF